MHFWKTDTMIMRTSNQNETQSMHKGLQVPFGYAASVLDPRLEKTIANSLALEKIFELPLQCQLWIGRLWKILMEGYINLKCNQVKWCLEEKWRINVDEPIIAYHAIELVLCSIHNIQYVKLCSLHLCYKSMYI